MESLSQNVIRFPKIRCECPTLHTTFCLSFICFHTVIGFGRQKKNSFFEAAPGSDILSGSTRRGRSMPCGGSLSGTPYGDWITPGKDTSPLLGCTRISAHPPALAFPFCRREPLGWLEDGGAMRDGWERGPHALISLHQTLRVVKRQVFLASCFGRHGAGAGRVPWARDFIAVPGRADGFRCAGVGQGLGGEEGADFARVPGSLLAPERIQVFRAICR